LIQGHLPVKLYPESTGDRSYLRSPVDSGSGIRPTH
jgi:hypothetical protein